MPRRLIDLRDARPLLDVGSYARRGSSRREHFSQAEIELIDRTVRRAPEVMVKVLSRGGQDLKAVGRHIAYLNRGGELEVETDDGQRLSGKGIEKELLEDWDLDLEEHRRTNELECQSTRTPPKLAHKLMFSMPPGTPPEKVRAAVKNLAREEFGLKHRYAMVLHTNEPHPHVHLVVKAVSEEGVRLNIRKATLRIWRREFAKHLRAIGVAANATERAVRGETRTHMTEGIYRATSRGVSTYFRARVAAVAAELRRGEFRPQFGKSKLVETRNQIERGWRAVGETLLSQGQYELSAAIGVFIDRLGPVRTDKEILAAGLLQAARDGPAHAGRWREDRSP